MNGRQAEQPSAQGNTVCQFPRTQSLFLPWHVDSCLKGKIPEPLNHPRPEALNFRTRVCSSWETREPNRSDQSRKKLGGPQMQTERVWTLATRTLHAKGLVFQALACEALRPFQIWGSGIQEVRAG